MHPKLSICIPTYNRAKLLKQQLKSLELALLRVPKENVEVVFHDNASSDNTHQVIHEFAQKFPVKYTKNKTNIGAIRNILSLPSGANGEYIWLLGDDDLVLPDAIEKIFITFEDSHDVKGIVVSHAIAFEAERKSIESSVLNGKTVPLKTCLIRSGTTQKYLSKFEEVFKLTDFCAAFNFLSNIIFCREDWVERVVPYLSHVESHEASTDIITAGGHTCLWAEIFIGKPVALITKPLVIGFIGQQNNFSKWDTVCWAFFLDLSKKFLKLGGEKDCIRFYQRNIYRNFEGLGKLVTSEDEFTRKHFSLKNLIRDYGDDVMLWQSFWKSFLSTTSQQRRLKFIRRLILAVLENPEKWLTIIKALFIKAGYFFQTTIQKKQLFKKKYPVRLEYLNQEATAYFKETVKGADGAHVQHPLYLKNQQYLSVGKGFISGPGLRIEAWDKYCKNRYSPNIKFGDSVCFNFNCHIGAINSVEIGNDVLIGSNVLITDHQHGEMDSPVRGKNFIEQPLYSKGPVKIGNNVWIGSHVCIMPNVEIGDNSIIGANAVVTKSFPKNSVICGVPAKVTRELKLQT